jgi:hypothetical protein
MSRVVEFFEMRLLLVIRKLHALQWPLITDSYWSAEETITVSVSVSVISISKACHVRVIANESRRRAERRRAG